MKSPLWRGAWVVLLCTFFLVSFVRGQTALPDIPVGVGPAAIAVNPVTNKFYVANTGDGSVSIIDGRTGLVTSVATGAEPVAVAVNPSTARIYVAHRSGPLRVIDGITGASNTIATLAGPVALAINPVTNRVYVALRDDGSVFEIDGQLTNSTLPVGTAPVAVAVNPQTNRIYVANSGSGGVTVLDGTHQLPAVNVPTGAGPAALAVNVATNRVYIANATDGTLTVLDGSDNTTSLLPVGSQPNAVTVNPATNTIYVSNQADGTVSVIDGATTATATVTVGAQPVALALDSAANQLFVASQDGTLTVIDGATNDTTTFMAGVMPTAVSVNPLTHRVLVANAGNGIQVGTVTVLDAARNSTTTLGAGATPSAIALNPVTGQIYVTNQADATVTAIDGASKTITTRAVGLAPAAVALNPATNRAYVANRDDGTVTVLDLAGGAPQTLTVGTTPIAVAVNPVTNRIYVANSGSDNVTVIDGATNGTSFIATGAGPSAVAVDPVTDRIYVTNATAGTVTVIDGLTGAATSFPAVSQPQALAVNPETGRVYVASGDSTGVAVIQNGAVIATVTAELGARSVAVSVATNRIYVTNGQSGSVTMIDGATNAPTSIMVGAQPVAVAVDAATNRIYVANRGDGSVSVIDGATGRVSLPVAVGMQPCALAISPATGEVYVANAASANVTVIAPSIAGTGSLASFIDALPGNVAHADPVSLHLSAVSLYGPNPSAVQQLYYQLDSTVGPWLAASPAGASSQASVSSLLAGLHTVYVFASDGQDATSANAGPGSSPVPGQVAAYSFITTGGAGSFSFLAPSVLAHNTDPAVSLVVQRNFTTPATVDYEAFSGSAVAGTNFNVTKGTLAFARDELRKTITVPLINADLGQAVAYFNVQLSNPSGTSVISDPGSEGVFLLNSTAGDLSISQLAQTAPDPAPKATGGLTVQLSPPEAAGQWRLYGALTWNDSGATVGGLTAGNYQIQFKPVASYATPPAMVAVITEGVTASADAAYTAGTPDAAGSLTVSFAPAGAGGWRLAGEAAFRDGGVTLLDLPAGSYLLEFAPVAGRVTPENREVFIEPNVLASISTTYQVADSATGLPPVLADGLSPVDPRSAPAKSFTGQIQTDSGFGSGFVPLDRIVVTAAHVLFDDGTLSFATGTRWLFQHDGGRFEAPPQIPRGSYVLQGYAAQRAADASPGTSTAASQQLDAAAMYFLEPSARGGQSGYLASNLASNPWLTSVSGGPQRDKFLAGYPMSGVPAAAKGRLHVTPLVTDSLVATTGGLFTTTALTGFPGTGGGPLFVGYNDPNLGEVFYPAAIYLGGTAQTVVRAIDGQVIDLMMRAEAAGNGGANNVGGGIVRVEGGLSGTTLAVLGSLNVVLQPPAVTGSARWGLAGGGINRRSGEEALNVPAGAYQIRFSDVLGYTTPDPVSVTVSRGTSVSRAGVYVPKPPTITSPISALAINGQPFSFRVTAVPAPRTFSTSSPLPASLLLHTDTGVIDGTPAELGDLGLGRVFDIALQATNDQGTGAVSMLKLTVASPGTLQVTLAGNGKGSVPTKFSAPSIQAVGAPLTIKAVPAKGSIFDSWSTLDPITGEATEVSRLASYPFVMMPVINLQATFILSPFPAAAGSYHGLLRGGDTLSGHGSITVTPTAAGSFSGSLLVGAQPYPLKGSFDSRGAYTATVKVRNRPDVVLHLQLDFANQKLAGTATVSGVTLAVQAWKAAFSAKSPAPQVPPKAKMARYTLALPHPADGALPQGDGYGTVTLTPAGAVHFAGTLGDGTVVSQGTSLGLHGEWPFFLLLYKNGGVLTGLLTIDPPPTGALAIQGALDWLKPAGAAAYQPGPFNTTVTAQGVPLGATPLAGLNKVQLTIGSGVLPQTAGPFTVHVDAKGKGTVANLSTFAFQITPATGLFTGKFPDAAGVSRRFDGVLLPSSSSAGFGLFKGDTSKAAAGKTGAVEFTLLP